MLPAIAILIPGRTTQFVTLNIRVICMHLDDLPPAHTHTNIVSAKEWENSIWIGFELDFVMGSKLIAHREVSDAKYLSASEQWLNSVEQFTDQICKRCKGCTAVEYLLAVNIIYFYNDIVNLSELLEASWYVSLDCDSDLDYWASCWVRRICGEQWLRTGISLANHDFCHHRCLTYFWDLMVNKNIKISLF